MRVVVETDGVETLVKTYLFLDTPVGLSPQVSGFLAGPSIV